MAGKLAKLFVALAGVVLALLLMGYLYGIMPLEARLLLGIPVQWLLMAVPLALMKMDKTSLAELGFSRDKIPLQAGIGLGLALGMSLLLTALPIALGLKEYITSASYTEGWQLVWNFAFHLFGVALAEEVVCRGYIYKVLKELRPSGVFATVVSSVVFGLLHLLNGHIVQAVTAALVGLLYCVCRQRIRHCTTLSLIIAHGVYMGLMAVWAWLL